MRPNERGRRLSADLHRTAGTNVTTFVEPAASIGGTLVSVEIDLKQAARKLECLAVSEPAYQREAEIIYLVARRVRGDRLAVAA